MASLSNRAFQLKILIFSRVILFYNVGGPHLLKSISSIARRRDPTKKIPSEFRAHDHSNLLSSTPICKFLHMFSRSRTSECSRPSLIPRLQLPLKIVPLLELVNRSANEQDRLVSSIVSLGNFSATVADPHHLSVQNFIFEPSPRDR